MTYDVNPFLERRSERTTSDQEFTLVFSPKILEKLSDAAFQGGIHVFLSAPGGGKTTIFRALTPSVLRTFWRAKGDKELKESFPLFVQKGVLDEREGPQLLGVMLSCASGYADLPPTVSSIEEGPFRALLDCRVVLRTIRSLSAYLGSGSDESLDSVKLEYSEEAQDIQSIPRRASARELAEWAESREKKIYAELDAFAGRTQQALPSSPRLESVLWLQSVRFTRNGEILAPKRLLMIDDLHRLRSHQRDLLIDELTVQRPGIPIWLAMRTLVLGEALLSQGARAGRDINEYALEELWAGPQGGHQFGLFAQNVLERRMGRQYAVPGTFRQRLREQLEPEEITVFTQRAAEALWKVLRPHRNSARYIEWIARAEEWATKPTVEALLSLFVTRILATRDMSRRQLSFDLALPAENLDDKDSSSLRGAAEIQLHEELGLPYFYGFDRLCVMATFNVEELLSLAAALYDGVVARQILGKGSSELEPSQQEKILYKSAYRRLEFIPKHHTEGGRAQELLMSIGSFCREHTFEPNAPYAPGVTGVRLSRSQMELLERDPEVLGEQGKLLKRVLSECVAENLLVHRKSSASTTREPGSIFYLNRMLCACFGLPLQMGGWQDVTCQDLIDWMARGRKPNARFTAVPGKSPR